MKLVKALFLLAIIMFSSNLMFSQATSRVAVKIKVDKINSFYRDLITDDRGVVNRESEELIKVNQIMKDSVLAWSKKFNINDADGFHNFGTFLGNKLNIKSGKKVELKFIDTVNNKSENYYLWSLANGKYEFILTKEAKR